jgi:6-phosphogluconolactonase
MRFLFSLFTPARTRRLLLLLAGLACGPATSATAGPGNWVYFGTYTTGQSQGIYAAQMDAAGKLTAPQLAAALPNPSFLAVDSQRRFLCAVSEVSGAAGKKQGDVTAYAINARNGRLTELNQQLSGGDALCHVQIDATGKTVLVASYGGGSVTAFPVNADGSLGHAACFIQHHGSSVNPRNQAGPHAHCIVTDPANRFALACDLGMDKVLIYKLDASAATLTPNTPAFASLASGAGPRHLAFHPNGKFVYVVNEMGCSVTVFHYDAKRGALAEVQTISTLADGHKPDPAFSGAEVVVHPSGKFLYTSTRGPDFLSVFSIDEKTGKLSHLENVPSGGKTPRNFNLDPAGNFLLAANQNSDNVVVFRIDPATGKLTPTGQSVEVGNPSCVVFGPADGPAR